MRLYLVRHSVPDDGSPEEDDDDPALTDEGRIIAEAVGQWMVDNDEVPSVLIASPTMRTQETAEAIQKTIREAGLSEPDILTDASIGPHMSIRGSVLKLANDRGMKRAAIVSHHESIEHGLRVLNLEPWIHLDIFAQGELRILKVDRDDGSWTEKTRVSPSDLALDDHY